MLRHARIMQNTHGSPAAAKASTHRASGRCMPGGRSYERQIKTPKRIAKRKAELDSEGYQVSVRKTSHCGLD